MSKTAVPRPAVRALRALAPRKRALILVGAVLLAVTLAFPILADLRVTGSPVLLLDSDMTPAPEGSQVGRTVDTNENGLVAPPYRLATATVPLELGDLAPEDRRLLRLWVYGGSFMTTTVQLLTPRRREVQALGDASTWVGKTFDISRASRAQSGRLLLRITAFNRDREARLFVDKVELIAGDEHTRTGVAPVPFAIWIGAALLLGIIVARVSRWSLLLPLPAAIFAGLLWVDVRSEAFIPADPALVALWERVASASWFGIDSGMLWGSFETRSHLTAQLLHLTTPLVGEGAAAARAATVILAILALCAVWWAGARVAGAVGAITATVTMLLLDGTRQAALEQPETMCLILTGSLYVVAMHRCLGEPDRPSFGWLGAASALAILAEPLFLPGVLAVLVALGLRYGKPRTVVWAALIVLLALTLPNRLSVAREGDGDLFADTAKRAVAARNVEYAGEGHGAPSRAVAVADPYAGSRLGMTEYALGTHSPSVVAGATLVGAYESLAALARRDTSRLLGLIAFLLLLFGGAYLLAVPLLRWLLAAPLIISAPLLFLLDRGTGDAFAAAAFFLPGLLVGGGVLVYATSTVLGGRTIRSDSERPASAEHDSKAK